MSDPFQGLVAFVHVAEARSFKGAAARLGLSPAALSKAVARLEGELEVRLFDRTTRRVELTAEGALYLEHARAALDQVLLGRERVEAARQVAEGELCLALPFILGPWLVRRLPAFTERYPGLRVELRLGDRFSRLVDDHVDVAIRVGRLADSTVVARKLCETRWLTVAAPGYLARRGKPRQPEDLDGHECLVFRSPRGAEVPWRFRAEPGSSGAGATRSVLPSARVVLDQGELFVHAGLAGLGVVQVLSMMIEDELARGQLVELLPDYACAGPPIHALSKPGQQRVAKVRAMLDFLAASFAA